MSISNARSVFFSRFDSRHSDQVMIIRTTLSKWVVCSDLSFLLKVFYSKQGQELIPALAL